MVDRTAMSWGVSERVPPKHHGPFLICDFPNPLMYNYNADWSVGRTPENH